MPIVAGRLIHWFVTLVGETTWNGDDKYLWLAVAMMQVVVLRDGHIVCAQKVDYEPQCTAINPAQNEVAVGGGDRVCWRSLLAVYINYHYTYRLFCCNYFGCPLLCISKMARQLLTLQICISVLDTRPPSIWSFHSMIHHWHFKVFWCWQWLDSSNVQ